MSDGMLAVGCSIAHGQGNVEENYHPDNVLDSFPNLIADRIGIPCNNVSWPGASNEMIFHRAVDELTNNRYSHCLISWTGHGRTAWENLDEVFTFNLIYGKYEHKQKSFNDNFVDFENGIKYVSNVESKLIDVKKLQQSLVIKALTDDENNKLKNYQLSVRALCREKNINLVEVNALKNNKESPLYLLSPKLFHNPLGDDKHPPKSSYHFWAKDIFEKFYE